MRIDIHGGRGVDGLVQDLEGDPKARVARHGKAVQAVIEILLHVGRMDDGNVRGDEGLLALVRGRRRLGHMVVAGQHQHTAVFGRAGIVRMLEDVAAAVDAGALAVPDAVDAIVLGAGIEMDLLGAPEGGRREVLVEAGLEFDMALLDEFLGLPQRLVEGAQGRAAIARDVATGVEPGGKVPLPLHQGQPTQRLGPGQIDPARLHYILVVQGHRC